MRNGHLGSQTGPRMLYACVDGQKSLPSPGARGTCPTCDHEVLAKCGKLVAHHWAHVAGADCDPWSEPMGEWHRSWQGIVLPEYVEVVRGPHRADLVGIGDIVIELQHSPIDSETIAAREQFYGNMIWVFDATQRFNYLNQGHRAFFTLDRTKHPVFCRQRAFLDFGSVLVEVERWTDKTTIDRVSGYGLVRDRMWFEREFLQGRVNPNAKRIVPKAKDRLSWGAKSPLDHTKYPTNWNTSEGVRRLDKGTQYVPLNYVWRLPNGRKEDVVARIISRCPELANGWTPQSMAEVRECLSASPALIDGHLRALLSPDDRISASARAIVLARVLAQIDAHIADGRIPIPGPDAMAALRERRDALSTRRGPAAARQSETRPLFESP